ncbi:hypothetical protein EV363DRAFT_1450895 [Boletus edulis]|nr:hypothetical protein EV363DRAFT_1450895 [Boletus edulis]
MNIHDQELCWLCFKPTSCCNCEFSDSPWSRSTSQGSFYTFYEEPANFRVDEVGAFKNPELEIDDMIPLTWSRRGSHQPCAASTPKNNNDPPTWASPGTIPPPESSSPVGLDADSSPFSTDPALPMVHHEDLRNVDRVLCCHTHHSGQSRVKALFDHEADSNTLVFSTTTLMSRSPPLSADFSMPAPDELLLAICQHQVPADMDDVYVSTTRPAIKGTNDIEERDEIDRVSLGNLRPAFRELEDALHSAILGLERSIEKESALSRGTDSGSLDATTISKETRRDSIPSKMPSPRGLINSAQNLMDNCLKRRRSSVDCLSESKKAKFDRTVSHVSASCASDSSPQLKYGATEPASMRRAQSLISEASAFSEGLTDSLFNPSPQSTQTARPYEDKDYPPTLPSTPLPDSVDYMRSKANPLARTLAVYCRRSLDVRAISPVPIIAPPPHVAPTVVRCAEDYAIESLKALLLRERAERERDGLIVHDERRRERLNAIYGTDPSFSRRGSSSSSDSSDVCSQWEEESTCSTIEFQRSHELTPSVKIQILTEQHRLSNRKIWSNVFGIENDFRKEITRWILEKCPKEPVMSGEEHPFGFDLYDQLVNSPQTRFHAAQLFHRYFALPEQAAYWSEVCKYDRFERESSGTHGDSEYERSVWDLAVACMALSVKLHRDCLSPLRPVRAAEFLDMARYPMTHKMLELAQRDILYTFQFQLGSCTPQDVLDELWNALPTLRRATAPIGWTAVQRVTWDKLFESLLALDMMQYPITLLTAAALVDSLTFALACQFRKEAEPNVCQSKALAKTSVFDSLLDEIDESSWQIHLHDASRLVKDVVLDVKAVLHISSVRHTESL